MTGIVHPVLTEILQKVLPNARAELITLPLVSTIELFLVNEDFAQHELSQDQIVLIMEDPAYWAFCWASGQVLAKFVLDQPERVCGKRVLDFGSGSGVVAIAAAQAGAAEVFACDIDSDALLATKYNAKQNCVDIALYRNFSDIQEHVDLIIVADVLYDKANLPWLSTFVERASEVLVADSRVKNFHFPPYRQIAEHESTTVPDMDEFDEFRTVRIYEAKAKDCVNTKTRG